MSICHNRATFDFRAVGYMYVSDLFPRRLWRDCTPLAAISPNEKRADSEEIPGPPAHVRATHNLPEKMHPSRKSCDYPEREYCCMSAES